MRIFFPALVGAALLATVAPVVTALNNGLGQRADTPALTDVTQRSD